jgi:hypothetical protein
LYCIEEEERREERFECQMCPKKKKAEKQGIKSKMGDKVLRFTQKQREINR